MLENIKANKRIKAKRIGRGGDRGKTSGRGHKGQRQHGDHGIRAEIRDLIKKIPKLRGHGINRSRTVNSGRKPVYAVNLEDINKSFEAGETVTPEEIASRGLLRSSNTRKGKVKILATGELTKKINFSKMLEFSKTAKDKIEKAGGSIV